MTLINLRKALQAAHTLRNTRQDARAKLDAWCKNRNTAAYLCAKLTALMAKVKLRPHHFHQVAVRNMFGGERDVVLAWLPEAKMWALSFRIGREVYDDSARTLWAFMPRVEEMLAQAESGAALDDAPRF